jgi:hypothetical protein
MHIPYPVVRTQAFNTVSDHRHQFKLFDFDGQRLLKAYSTIFRAYSNLRASHVYISDVQNPLVDRISNYHIEIDDKRIQLEDLEPWADQLDSWNYNQSFINGSHHQSVGLYNFNWFHVEDFTGYRGDDRLKLYHDNILCGLPVGKELKYNWVGTGDDGANYLYVHVFVMQRKLTIKKNIVKLE